MSEKSTRGPWRILYVSFNMPWRGGGTFFRVIEFARHLVKRGHHVTVLATSVSEKRHFDRQQIDGVELILAPALLTGRLRTGWDPTEIIRRIQILKGRQFDIVHGFESRPVVIYPALYAQRKLGASLFLDWCDWFGKGGSVEARAEPIRTILRPVETFYEERFRTRAVGTTTINSVLQKRAEQLGVSANAIMWLPNGSQVERIQPVDQAIARKKLGLDPHKQYIGYLGQAFPDDAVLMAAAFRRVVEERDNVELILIGNHKTDLATYHDGRARLVETGFVDDEALNLYLAAADMQWLPLMDTLANRGRWPMKLSDYMSSGRPTLSTPVGDLTALFQGERPIGKLAADNADEFAAATIAMLDDPAGCHQLGLNARHHVDHDYAWELVTERLEAFYAERLQAET